jgi:general secretion pathway protein M
MSALKLWWAGLGAREQRLAGIAGLIVGIALLWWVAIAPALSTLRTTGQQHAAIDSQLQSMRVLANQARDLRANRPLSYEESLRNLESSVKQTLGSGATLAVTDNRASVNLRAVNADALALWLNQARINARVVPSEMRLTRTATAGASTSTSTVSSWDGTMVLTLPAR